MFLSQDLCVVCNFWSSARRKESRATPQRALAKNVSQKFRSCGFGAVWQLVFWRWNSLRCVFVTGMAVARTILLCWMFVWFDFVANNATTCFFFWMSLQQFDRVSLCMISFSPQTFHGPCYLILRKFLGPRFLVWRGASSSSRPCFGRSGAPVIRVCWDDWLVGGLWSWLMKTMDLLCFLEIIF